MLKKLIIGLLVIIVLLIGGLTAYISTIDWNKHKGKIAEQIENITGKRVVFEGQVSFSIFPTPYLTAKDIKVYNKSTDNSNAPLAVIRELITDLSLVPLLQGKFVINNMSLMNPNILIEFMPDGKLNWYSEITDFQKDTLDNIDIALNSVMLKDASIQIINKGLNVDVNLQNLNAEITAQSLYGPYRIDGNFVKDNNPAGFALTLGTLSESFATSLNLVLTHPTTESYARFDGSMLTSNNEIKGNFTVESKNPSTFINDLTNQVILPKEFNYPLAFSVELNTNNQQIDLSSFIIKYGDNTAGAGNILIPLHPTQGAEKPKVEMSFEMTDLDLMPLMGIIRGQLKKYDDGRPFEPYFDFDMIADIKAIKAVYNNQAIRNFNLSADLVNDVLSIKNFSGLFPGDTDIMASGDVFENEKTLSYDFKIRGLSQDFLKLLNWLDLKPQTYAPSTYRAAQFNLGISGNLKQIKISPLSLTVDKISLSGVAGIARDRKTRLFIALESESVNFDNYLPPLTAEEQKLPLSEKFKVMLNKLKFLNDYDIHFETQLGLGIYNKVPFEKLNVYLDSENGTVHIQEFNISDIASSNFSMSGNISGLGVNPSFENLKYDFTTDDFTSFLSKFNLPLPQWSLVRKAQHVQSKGIFTGNLNEATIKAVNILDTFNSVYSGKLFNQNNRLNFKGTLEFKTPDFTEFVNLLGFAYKPQNMAANIFTFKGKVSGNAEDWKANEIIAFVGSNNFQGDIGMVMNNNHPEISANIKANKFEFDRFIYNSDRSAPIVLKRDTNTANFLERPLLDKTNINYDVFKTFDFKGHLIADSFNYGTMYFENAIADLNITHGVIKVQNISLSKDKGLITGQFEIDVNASPKIKGSANIEGLDISNLGGKKYAVISGVLKATSEFDAPASSVADFIQNLNGKLSFDIDHAVFKGWDMEVIEDDLSKRTHSDNLFEVLRDNLQKGQSRFELIGAGINFKNGDYTFKDALMASGLATVDVSGSGSLKNWDTNTNFKVVFERLRDKTVPIDFKWAGPLNNPNLIVDGSALKNKYDSYWEKIAREKKAAEEARIKTLKAHMTKTQETVKRLKSLVAEEILPRIEKYKPLSSNAEIKSKYDSRHLLAIDINNELDAMQSQATKDFSENDIVDMNAKLDTFEPQLNDMFREIEENFAFDIKVHAGEAYGVIAGIYENAQSKAANYQQTLNAYVYRLMQLGSMVVLDRDPEATDYKNKIETSLRTIEDLTSKANSAREIIENSESIPELETQYKTMEDIRNKSVKALENLNAGLEKLFNYAKTLVRKEEYGDIIPAEESLENKPIVIISEEDEKTSTPLDVQVEKPLLKKSTEESPNPEQASENLKNILENQTNDTTKIITYQSKLAPSGTIVRGKKVLKPTKPAEAKSTQTAPLLRPITKKEVPTGGTIRKK